MATPGPGVRARVLRSPFTLVLLLLALIGCVYAAMVVAPRHGPAPSSIGGHFALQDQDGRPVSDASLRGKPFLVLFGYTHCPDVCPTTLSDMTQMLGVLPAGSDLAALFVTVDPERDTPAVMKDYLSSFDPRIRGLTGSPEAVDAMEKAYRVYAKKVPTKDGDYVMDHTAVVYLMDAQGRFVNAVNLGQPPAQAAAEVTRDLS